MNIRTANLIIFALALSFPLNALSQSSAPTITSLSATVADRNTRLIINGSNFTSYNTIHVTNGIHVLDGTATSFNGTTALANLRTPAGGAYQVTLTTSRGQTSNPASVTVNAPAATPVPVSSASTFPQVNPFAFYFSTPDPSRSLRFSLIPPRSPGCSIACPLSTNSSCIPCRPPFFNLNSTPAPTPTPTFMSIPPDFQSGNSRFSRGPCQSDNQCFRSGCSREACTSDPEGAITTCEFKSSFPSAQGLTCGCLPTNVCGWR